MSRKAKSFSFTHEQNYYVGNVELINSTTTKVSPGWRIHLEAKKTPIKKKEVVLLRTSWKNKTFEETSCTSLLSIMTISIESDIKEEIVKTLELQRVAVREFFIENIILPLVEESMGRYALK